MDKYIFDIETDAIDAKKIHCLVYCNEEDGILHSTTDYEEMREFFLRKAVFIGHNIYRFDCPIAEQLLNITIKRNKIDTLALSWYLSSERARHGLESYGEDFGIAKPKIEDWEGLDIREYIHRCEEDVKINLQLWRRQYRYLRELYDRNDEQIIQLTNYLSFKMECVAEQEQLGIRLDVTHCKEMLYKLEKEKEIKMGELIGAMPKVPVIGLKRPPKVMYKADGELSSHGESWKDLLTEKTLPEDYYEPIEVIKGYEEPNPNSHDQIKKWLYGLGWVPGHIKHVRDKKKNTVKKIPQIASRDGGGEICESIKVLYEKEPKLELLNGLSVLSHRISVFKAFLADVKNGVLFPTIAGLTNTLRLQHSVIVNLPGLDKKWGKEVRACLIPFDGNTLIGSDLANIEDRTKRHYIYIYDPEYVEDMNVEGYDAHLEIAVLAGLMTQEEADWYKIYNKETKESPEKYQKLWDIRQKAKIVNFSSTYKIGVDALARNSNISVKESKRVLQVYWERNKSILKVEQACIVKEIGSKKWLLNPVSNFYYQLRAEKDRFSTLNQGTAVFVFDLWLAYIRKLGLKINFQYHDEFVANVKTGEENWARDIVNEAVALVNDKLRLNVPIGCSVNFGDNYSEIH